MNRIVLIGNGFDLANDYKTSYKDFIVWYFKEILYYVFRDHNKHYNDDLCKIDVLLGKYEILPEEKMKKWEAKDAIEHFEHLKRYSDLYKIEFSPFLSKIIESVETKGWVDIESDYYNLLCTYTLNKDDDGVENLNKCLDFVKEKLIEYLEEVVKEQKEIHQEIKDKIFGPFKSNDIAVKAKDAWNEFLKRRFDSSEYDLIKLCSSYKMNYGDFLSKENEYKVMLKDYLGNGKPYDNYYTNLSYPDNIMLLNFNYTDIADRYLLSDSHIFSVVHIHGRLDDPKSIIFGYGDEFDKFYKEIKEQDNHEFLNNIKSIRYLEADNYNKVLSFIESDYYQVYVMGHSCGKSDRTLLNTLFEHKNCVSIKPFYYIDDKGKDHYLDIVQNINRILINETLADNKIVNKQYCEQLRKK